MTQLISSRTSGRLSENIYTFTAEAGDNKARFRCEASNVMSQNPLKAEVELSVLCKSSSKGSASNLRCLIVRSSYLYMQPGLSSVSDLMGV